MIGLWSRARGIAVLYAAIAMAMLGVMSISLTDGSQSTLDGVQSSIYTQLARYAAESGIEYGIGVLDAQLSHPCPIVDPKTFKAVNDPNRNPLCTSTSFHPCSSVNVGFGWEDPAGAAGDPESLCPDNSVKKSLYPFMPAGWGMPGASLVGGADADVERVSSRYMYEFRLSMSPAFDTANVVGKILFGTAQPVFALRSRGIVRGGADPNVPGSAMMLGHCTLVAKLRVSGAGCNQRGRIQRISMDIVPTSSCDRGSPTLDFPKVTQPH